MNVKHCTGIFTIITFLAVVAATDVHAQNSNMRLAYEAFQAGKAYKNQGDLVRARKMYEMVLSNAGVDTNVYREAETELNYYLPLMEIQRLVWDGKTAFAEKELLALQQKFDGQPIRRQEIGRILSGLKTNDADSTERTEKVDERLLMQQVKQALNDFYRVNNSYPTNSKALSEVLPLDQPPLSAFNIRRYSSNGSAYLLILRSKNDPGHLLTLQHTGLMQSKNGTTSP